MISRVIGLIAVLAPLISHSLAGESEREDFLKWMQRMGKTYASADEEEHRFDIWLKNLKYVEQINAANISWTATIDNKFGDMTTDEFKYSILLPPSTAAPFSSSDRKVYETHSRWNRFFKYGDTPPDTFDWRDYGAVTEVQDQGSVGTCWAFSTVANIEGQWFLAEEELVNLSEEFLVDCDGTADYDERHADCGVFGGWPYLAYQFVISAGGVPTEATDPYCAGTGDCFPCMQGPIELCGPPPYYCDRNITKACPTQDLYATISDWTAVGSDEEAEMLPALLELGPLSVLLDATQLQFYASGVWSGKLSPDEPDYLGCSKSYLDHAVLVVGYGVDAAAGPYWTVKNSWGQGWGEEGYFRITRNEGACGINTAVTSALI